MRWIFYILPDSSLISFFRFLLLRIYDASGFLMHNTNLLKVETESSFNVKKYGNNFFFCFHFLFPFFFVSVSLSLSHTHFPSFSLTHTFPLTLLSHFTSFTVPLALSLTLCLSPHPFLSLIPPFVHSLFHSLSLGLVANLFLCCLSIELESLKIRMIIALRTFLLQK